MHHSRTDTTRDDEALRYLSGCEFKSYRYLVNRADVIGICYPRVDTIAAAIGYEKRQVERALVVLNDNDVFRYRRKNQFDPVARRKVNNVYQVNPDILMIAPKFEAEARSEWDALIDQCGNVSIGLWCRINQHQEPIPEPIPGSNARDLTPKTTSASKAKGGAADENPPHGQRRTAGDRTAKKQNPDGETGQRAATTNQRAKPAEQTGSAARPQYANPESINTNLPDREHELLASQIRVFGISMPLARGFVVTYGYKRVMAGYEAVREMGNKARQPAAVFRSIVQIRLAEDFALAQEQIFRMLKQ